MIFGLSDPNPDPLVRGSDLRIRIHIRIRTKMSHIRNTAIMVHGLIQLGLNH